MKQISTDLYTKAKMDNIDPEHWYIELFDNIPIYQFFMDINRIDEDEDFDIYSVIFNDLISTGEFEPLLYEFCKENGGRKKPRIRSNEEGYYKNSESTEVTKFILVSKTEPVMIYYSCELLYVYTHLGTEKINEFVYKYLKKYDQDDDRVKCHIIVKDPDLYMDNFPLDINGDLDFDLYNEGFDKIHESIVESVLNDKNGIYLLYGEPGTGKSTYIKYLVAACETKKQKFVYVPSCLFGDFTDPTFLPFLIENRGCVFIIEDCEDLITVNEEDGRSEGIADLLNMTDGILADALNIKIICTFNTDYENIDEALLRPGRCRCNYEFKKLDKDRANKVAKKLGLKEVKSDVTLAELFNNKTDRKEEKKRKIGFN